MCVVLVVFPVRVVDAFQPGSLTCPGLPLFFRRSRSLVYPVYDGYPLRSAALDRQLPGGPSRTVRRDLVVVAFCSAFGLAIGAIAAFRHVLRITGGARQTRNVPPGWPPWPRLSDARSSWVIRCCGWICVRALDWWGWNRMTESFTRATTDSPSEVTTSRTIRSFVSLVAGLRREKG